MTMEVKFPNERYEDYSNEDLFAEIIHMICEMRARYDIEDELKGYLQTPEQLQ